MERVWSRKSSSITFSIVLLVLNGIHASLNTKQHVNFGIESEHHLNATHSEHSVHNITPSRPIITTHLAATSSGSLLNNDNTSTINPGSNGTALVTNNNGTDHETATQITTTISSDSASEMTLTGSTDEITEGKSSTIFDMTTTIEITTKETIAWRMTTRGEDIASDLADDHISSTTPTSSTEHTQVVVNDLPRMDDVSILIACVTVSSFFMALMIWGVCYSRINRYSRVENEGFGNTFKLFIQQSRPLDDYDRVQFQRLVED